MSPRGIEKKIAMLERILCRCLSRSALTIKFLLLESFFETSNRKQNKKREARRDKEFLPSTVGSSCPRKRLAVFGKS